MVRRFSFVNAGKLTIKIRDARLTETRVGPNYSTLRNGVQLGRKVNFCPKEPLIPALPTSAGHPGRLRCRGRSSPSLRARQAAGHRADCRRLRKPDEQLS